MTELEYNAAEGIRRSDLWKMEDSPEKFLYNLKHPAEQTAAMLFGSACHKYILEGDEFFDEYAVAPNVDRRTNAGKEEWKKFAEANEGKEIITSDNFETMMQMAFMLGTCRLASDLMLRAGQSEVPFFWKDPATGEACKIKCDRVIHDEDGKYIIVDYKTAKSAETNRFNTEIFKLGYYMQAGMYTEGLMNALDLDYRPRFLFVVQEKDPPFSVNVIEVPDDVMKVGVAKFHELLEKYHECKAVDMWPGYVGETPNDICLPGWWSLQQEDE